MSKARFSGHAILALVCAPLLAGSACEKKKPVDTGAITAMDHAAKPAAPVDETPLPNVDTRTLTGERLKLYYKLLGSLNSPCGKGHNLRTSFLQDTSCKRAPFAVKYVVSLLVDEQNEEQVREFYAKKYEKQSPKAKLDLSKAPHVGPTDAPVRLVEFFDYQCPHCANFAPILAKVEADEKGKIVTYFMMFPLEGKHPEARSAAQASLAAAAQGKFEEMHRTLFEKAPAHAKQDVAAYAAELGLDPAKFAADYEAASTQVTSDVAQGEANGVDSTPTLFFNDHRYDGPMLPEYIEMWIDEELAVNR